MHKHPAKTTAAQKQCLLKQSAHSFVSLSLIAASFLYLFLINLFTASTASTASTAFAATGAAVAPVTITLSQARREIPVGFFGYNTALTLANLTWSPSVGATAAGYAPGMLRFPGGTISDYWSWQKGGVNPSNPGTYTNQLTSPRVWLDEFLRNGIGKTGATPIYVLNMLTSTVDDQIAMLERAEQLGYPVTHAELGNEYYYQPFQNKFPSGRNYAAEAQRWSAKIKSRFPRIKLGIVTSDDSWGPGTWNAEAAHNVPSSDALIQHLYTPTGIGTAKISSANVDTFLAAAVSKISTDLQSADQLAAATGKDIWVTEFNCYDWQKNGCDQERQSWAHGLYVAEMASQIALYPRVKHMLVHQLLAYSPSGAIVLSSTNQPTATGLIMQWYAWAAKEARVATPLQFSTNANLSGHYALMGTQFSGPSGNRVFILNLSSTATLVDTSAIAGAGVGAQCRQRSAAITTHVTDLSSISESKSVVSGPLTLAPYSVTVLFGG